MDLLVLCLGIGELALGLLFWRYKGFLDWTDTGGREENERWGQDPEERRRLIGVIVPPGLTLTGLVTIGFALGL